MAYESELARRLTPYTAGEQPRNRKFIKLNTNENPYPPSPRVVEALRMYDADALRLYPDMDATALCEAIGEAEKLPADWVFCGNGSDDVLAFAFAAFFAGKSVAIPAVTYSFYPVYAGLFGASPVSVPMKADFSVDDEALMQCLPIVLANPNAPTGMALSVDRLRILAQHTHENGAVLLIDEAYAAFAKETAVSLLSEFDNVLITRTFSKSHALAGMRIGYAMGRPTLIAALKRIRDSFNSYPVDRIAQLVAREAILDTDYAAKTAAAICRDRDECRNALLAAGIPVLESQTNFLFVRADDEDASGVQQRLREEGILVRHFSSPNLRAYLRVTIGTAEDMQTVTRAIIQAVKRGAASHDSGKSF